MQSSQLSGRFRAEILSFLDVVKAERLQSHLLHLLWLYMADLNTSIPLYHEALVWEMEALFNLLEAAKKEQRKIKRKKKKRVG